MQKVPRIVTHGYSMSKRWYVEFYFNNERHRIYNGKLLGLDLSPNRCDIRDERIRLINTLYLAVLNSIHAGTGLFQPVSPRALPSIKKALDEALNHKLKYPLSDCYKHDLTQVHRQLLSWYRSRQLQKKEITEITPRRLDEFLLQFNTGSTYYRTKRRTLSALLSVVVNFGYLGENPVKKTTNMRATESLHEYYNEDQLYRVLGFLSNGNQNLYLACLLAYGCLLRPHVEIKGLVRSEFSADLSQIHLSGKRTKTGRLRKVAVPDFVQVELRKRGVHELPANINIFSNTADEFKQYYFNTAWTREKNKMLKMGIINKKQTIYSFRHTAAVHLYMRTRSLHKVMVLMGHSSLQVTLKYLRSLGIEEGRNEEIVMPELPKIKTKK